jgi:hypothetical protein
MDEVGHVKREKTHRDVTDVTTLIRSASFVLALCCAMSAVEASSFTVTTTADSGTGSLRQGISATPAGGSIDFNMPTSDAGYNPVGGVFTITLISAELQIGRDLIIDGPTNAKLAISGNNARRVFNVVAGNVTMTNPPVTKGAAAGTPGTDASDSNGMSFPATPGGAGQWRDCVHISPHDEQCRAQ